MYYPPIIGQRNKYFDNKTIFPGGQWEKEASIGECLDYMFKKKVNISKKSPGPKGPGDGGIA